MKVERQGVLHANLMVLGRRIPVPGCSITVGGTDYTNAILIYANVLNSLLIPGIRAMTLPHTDTH